MPKPKSQLYRNLAAQLGGLLEGEHDPIANAANVAALIWYGLPDLNWAGFYFRRGSELMLGPFQGKPACVRIPIGKGVCGTAAERGASVVVSDVHEFPGHITCDPNFALGTRRAARRGRLSVGRARSRQPGFGPV